MIKKIIAPEIQNGIDSVGRKVVAKMFFNQNLMVSGCFRLYKDYSALYQVN
jgi:hypothetical protein